MDPVDQALPTAEGTDDEPQADLVALMAKVAQGDEQAFGLLYDALSPQVYGIAQRVLRNAALAQEVTQETFLTVWQQAPGFDRDKGSVKTWVAVIAHRRSVDRVRSEQARSNREERMTPVDDRQQGDPVMEEATDSIDRTIDRDRLRRALSVLTDAQREAVQLAYFEGYTYRQVATVLGAPEGTVKARIRTGMIRLRQALGVTS
jgi:RNA polymerase sigma-70 factor (ECF subfamily)